MAENQRKGLIMKNLLRKLHLGNGNDHYDRLDEERMSPETTPLSTAPSASSSAPSAASSTVTSYEHQQQHQQQQQRHSGFGWRRRTASRPTAAPGTSEDNAAEIARQAEIFNVLDATSNAMMALNELHAEEEYQVQLALALSVSKTDGIDPEVVEIEAAKRISLGLSPSPDSKLAEVITGRYWAYNLLSYDDKVVDGFYDVYSIFGPLGFDKLPSMAELQETEISDSITFEVIFVNRVFDPDLVRLEQRAMCLRVDCSILDANPIRNGLAQRIAELVIEEMGGVVTSDVDILAAWRARGWELRAAVQSIVWPLGMLGFGLARHRALLFKVLADCVGLPCRLVKGKHYTGVDDGVLNILRDVDGREYIIDLMGTPGTLIPLDVTVASYTATTSKVIKNGENRAVDSGNKQLIPSFQKASDQMVVALQTSEQAPTADDEMHSNSKVQAIVVAEDFATVNTDAETKRRSLEAGGACKSSSLDNNHVQKRKENSIGSPCSKHRSYNRHSSLLEDVAEWEINWDDLNIGERIGIGSYGEVYHGEWSGTEVAIKKFLDQDLSGDAMDEFRSEVQIMRRLSHPNVVLFMGAVAHPPNLAIVTEYLPRGSLFKLLHKPYNQLDRRKRLQMALDVAKGMNYLHSAKPVVVHRDLKSPNLLVDKNWVVKVCDFGLSRIKHSTFLSSKSTAGTPEWMAPEVLRNEPSNEKSDVFSFGVILWELATSQKPWHGMNPMQVVGAVGFQHRRLQIPADVDPSIASIIHECWQNDPTLRPSFEKILHDLQAIQRPAAVLVGQASNNSNSFKPNNHQLKIHYQQQLHAVPLKGVAFSVEGVGSHVSHINALDFAVRAQVP